MPRISTDNYDTVAAWNGSQDLFVVEQPDGTKVATPEQVKQYILNDMDEVPTQDSENPVKSGGTKTYVDNAVSQLNDEIDALLITDTYTTTPKDFTAGTNGYCSASGVSKSGYTVLGIIDIDSNKSGFGLTTWHCDPGSSSVVAWLRPFVNLTGLTITFKILYIKNLS